MGKKKNITQNDIISWYMEYVLEHNQPPGSVFSFAKKNNFEEAVFYTFFGSFEALESEIFKTFHDNTLAVLEKSEDYTAYDTRNKLLSFYYTFFENLTANRSYVMYALKDANKSLKSLKILTKLRNSFKKYIGTLEIETIDLKEERLENIQKASIQESAWIQLLITIKFWMEDTSPSFEKTDIFIEKSVKASFDLLDTTPFKSIIDLGKFWFKEKMQRVRNEDH